LPSGACAVHRSTFNRTLLDETHINKGIKKPVELTAVDIRMLHYRKFGLSTFLDGFHHQRDDLEVAPVFLAQRKAAGVIFFLASFLQGQGQVRKTVVVQIRFHALALQYY
jgi:hypothetical protein